MHGTIGTYEEEPRRVVYRRHNDWTLKEHEVVVSFWPELREIEKRLPHRTRNAIRSFAGKCNLRRTLHIWTEEQSALLRRRVREGVPQKQIAKELGLTPLQVANRMRYCGLTFPRRPPKLTGNDLIDAIRRRAFDCNMTMRELDEACNSGSQFEKYAACRHIGIKHIVKATKILDGDLAIRWREL